MKKAIKIIMTLTLFIIITFIICACNTTEPVPKHGIYKLVLDKSTSFYEIKQYTKLTDIYLFDCDFSNFSYLNIKQTSYNIYLSGYLIQQENANHKVLDLNEQTDVAFISNYQVSDSQYIYGFSIVSRIMESKANHYINDELAYTSDNEFYDATSFTSIKTLHNNGISNLGGANYVAVPNGFFPPDYTNNYTSSEYLKLSSSIDSIAPIQILAQPVYIITWNKAYDSSHTAIYQIIDYFTANAIYTKY